MTESVSSLHLPMVRRIDAQQLASLANADRLRALGVRLHEEVPLAAGPLLRFKLRRGAATWSCLVDVHDWAQAHLMRAADWAWTACDAYTASQLFGHKARPLDFTDEVLAYDKAHFEGLVGVAEVAAVSCPLPCVAAQEGYVWLEAMDLPSESVTQQLPNQLPLTVQFHIGSLDLKRRQLAKVRCGDVLLLDQLSPQARIERAGVFTFYINENEVVVNDIFDDFSVEVPHPVAAEPVQDTAERKLDLGNVPVSVEVVLCQLQYTVGELGNIQAGSALSLPDGAHRSVSLRLHGHIIGKGELVQVGDGLGVQLSSALSVS